MLQDDVKFPVLRFMCPSIHRYSVFSLNIYFMYNINVFEHVQDMLLLYIWTYTRHAFTILQYYTMGFRRKSLGFT